MALTSDNKASRLFKALMGVSETKTIRDFFEEPIRTSPPVLPNQVWQYGTWIPTGSASDPAGADAILAIQAMNTDQQVYSVNIDSDTVIHLVKRWIKCQFSMIDAGTNNSFRLVDTNGDPIKNIIPFNFGDGTSYNYNLYKSDGSTPIAFGIGDWVFDPNSGVLTFYNIAALSGVDADHPPVISFYQYIGGNGIPSTVAGYDGAVLNITGYNGGVGTTTWSDSTLDAAIANATNQVQQNFLSLHGWVGSDTSEGVAVAYQKLIPLTYSSSHDPVATGSGTDASEVVTLMARRGITSNLMNITGFVVDFVSQGTPIGTSVQIKYESVTGNFAMSFDGGATWGPAVSGANTLVSGQAFKVKNGSEFAIIRRMAGTVPVSDVVDTLTIADTITRVALLAWSASANDYLPYVNTDSSSNFNFGFPIVLKIGKIPPSFKLTSSGGYGDVITPQYYGSRPTSLILAVQDLATPANNTSNSGGSDYIVTNASGGYLDDVITTIYNANPTFVGELVLRAGHYKLNSDLSLTGVRGLKIKGEAPEAVVIDANGSTRNINIQSGAAENDVFINDVLFNGAFSINLVAAGTAPAMLFMRGVLGPSVSITVADKCGAIVSECPSLYDLIINGTSTVTRSFESSVFHTVTLNGSGASLHGDVITSLAGNETTGVSNAIAACQIGTLTSLNEANQYIGNAVTSYGSGVSDKFKMLPQKFEVIDTDGVTRRWTGFAGPIIWDNTAKVFKLSYDTTILSINGDGELTVNASADLISFNNVGVTRADGTPVTADTVQNAIVDLYSHKADLDAQGKLALSQLPASVTAGGMIYKGMWEFDAHSGAYPTAADLGGTLMPGWFILVSASNDPESPASPQKAEDDVYYSAGDWAVYDGAGWEKVDNSFADPSYTILPSVPPDGQWSDGLLALGGTTLVDATDQINEILAKLAPPKPVNLNTMALAFKSTTTYSASIAGSGVVNSSVVSVTQPAATTPTGTDSISTLFYDGDTGTLTAYIDGVASGSKVLSTASDVGTYSALVITADNDPWAGTSGKANFWKGLRAEITPTAALALGAHNYVLTHSSSGSTAAFNFYVDNPAAVMSISGSSLSVAPAMSKYLSGVPSVAPSDSFTISAFNAVGVVGQCYNTSKVAAISCNVSGVSTVSLAASAVPSMPAAGTYTDATVAAKAIAMPASAYSENIIFTITPYNSRGTAGTATALSTGYRIDTTTESERVCSGDPTNLYPTISTSAGACGAVFDSTQSLVGTYTGELQKINGHYIWPVNTSYASYTGTNGAGPDYTGAAGSAISGLTGTWRWVTYKIASAFANNSAFTLTFNTPTGFSADTNQVTANMLIYAKVVGASGTGWLNANAAYSGAGTPAVDGDAAMVAGNSDASNKRVTFGTVVRTGDLYIRVAIKSGSGIQFNGVSIGSLA